MSLRWKGNRRLKELTTSSSPTLMTHHRDAGGGKPIISRRIELEIGVKGITGLPCSPSSPTSGGSSGSSGGDDGDCPQTTVCVTWRKNGKLEHGEDKRRQREGITLTAKVGHDGACAWEFGRMSVVPCHIRKFDAKADVCDHKTVTFHVNQVVGSRTKKLKKAYEATLDLDRLTLYPTVYEEQLVLRPLGLRKHPPHHGIAWLLIEVRVLNFKALPRPSEPAASTTLQTNGDESSNLMNPRDWPITAARAQSIGSAADGDRSLGKAARRLSQQLQRVMSMPVSEEGKPKESKGEDYEEIGTSDSDDDAAERARLEREEAERYIRLYLDGYKEKTTMQQRQHKTRDKDQAQVQSDPRRDSEADRHDSHEAYDERIAHYETVVRQMQETREQMHREIDELVQQLEETKLDAARLLHELELHEARQQQAGGEEGPDEPLRTREAEETARMVDDLRSLIIEREDQLTELRDQVRRRTDEIDLVTRERDDEREAARELVEHCHELRSQLESAERERDEVRSTLDQVLSQASVMHDELEEKEIKLAKLEELAQQRESVGEEDVAAARLEAETLREVVDEHRQSLDELTLRLSDKRRKYAERKSQLAALEGVISEKQDELDAMTRNRNELHQRCEELEAERERLIAEREAECAAKEARRSEKAEHQASIEQMSPISSHHDQPDRQLLRELSEAKKRLRQKRQEVVEFDEALAEMANATRASEEQVAAWESQLLACRQRIAELGSPRSDARHDPAKAERGQRAIAECEADIETLQHYVMAELESMREVARRYGRVRERRDEAARACEELTQQASGIKHEILKTRKRSKARRTSSMTRAHSAGDVLSSEDRADAATARQELESVRWEAKTRALIERHVWSYDSNKRQSATAGTAVKEILGQMQVFQQHGADSDGADTLASLVHGLMRALARSHKRATGLEEQIHWLSFSCHLLHGLKSSPESASFFHPAVFYSVPDPAESGVGVSKVKFRVQGSEQGASEVLVEKDDALVANYTSFLWMQKLHNLILGVYREIVALACASIEPVINALMQPRRPQGPPQPGYQHAALSRSGGSESDPKAQQEEAAGIRTFARSTRETLRGLGFMKTKPSEVAPAVLDSDYETDKCVREFKRIVASLFELLIAEGVHETVVVQLCKQLFHHLDVSLLHIILTSANAALRSPSHAVKIKYFLSQLVDWCLHHDSSSSNEQDVDEDQDEAITLAEVLQQSRAFLERHTAEATSLLVMDKERIREEGDNLRALFRHLNSQQIVQLLEKINADEPSNAGPGRQSLSATSPPAADAPQPPVQLPISLLSFQQSLP